MAAISAKDVNKLRQMTGAGMMDCKEALTESGNDFDAAVEYLRKKGQKVSSKRADKEASEGNVFVRTSEDGKTGYIISLNCETDFVAKNDDFQQLGNTLVEKALDHDPSSVEELNQSKLDDGKTVEDFFNDLIGKIGEKIEVGAFEKLTGERVISYVHTGSKLGVLVTFGNVNGHNIEEIGRDIAMQIAAMKPVGVDENDVPSDVVEREKEFAMNQAREEGKPENIVEKIADGKLNKFFKEHTLLNQAFVKDSDKTVSDVLKDIDPNLTVETFKRVSVDGS